MIHNATYDRFISTVMRRGAIPDRPTAHRVSQVTLRIVGSRLGQFEAEQLAEHLPPPLDGALRARDFAGRFGPDELYARVARQLGQDLAPTREQVQGVCRTLADCLVGEARARLDTLPDDLSVVFRGRVTAAPPSRPADADETSIAGAVPPIARDGATTDRAHRDSVARKANPHGDRKLATAETVGSLANPAKQ